MKTLVLIILAMPLLSMAQNPIKISFNLVDKSATLTPRGDIPTEGIIEIILLGELKSGCQIIIGSHAISCKEALSIAASGEIAGTGLKVERPFAIKVINDGNVTDSVSIPGKTSRQTAGEADKKRKATNDSIQRINKVCETSGEVLIWRDVLTLENAITENDSLTTKAVLGKYVYPDASCQVYLKHSYRELRDLMVNANVFLGKVLPENLVNVTSPNSNQFENKVGAEAGNVVKPAIASPSVALDAIATFIAKRFVDELNRAYIDRLQESLKGDKLKDLTTILPQTKGLLTTVGQDYTLDYKSLLTGLRQNFFEDLSHLSLNAPGLLKNHKAEIIKTSPELYISGLAMLEVINSLHENVAPPEIISRLGKYDYHLGKDTSNTLLALQLAAKISNHLRLNNSNGPWIGIGNNFQKPRVIYLFAGLLFKYEAAFFEYKIKSSKDNKTLSDLLQEKGNSTLIDLIYQALGLIKDVDEIISANNEEKNAVSKFFALSEKVLNFVALNTNDTLSTRQSKKLQKGKVIDQIKMLIRLEKHIAGKEFVAAGTLAFTFVESIKGDTIKGKGKEEFFRYLSFAQNLIDATTKEELMEALEQAADPVGSYRNKRYYPMTVSVTAFPGLFAGKEEYRTNISNAKPINTGGFTAPLGLAVSFANQGNCARTESTPEENEARGSFSLFLPILDVGAITSFRLVDQNAAIPDYQWSNFISPGIFGDWGFKNSPLNLHFGLQYGPEIKKVKDDPQPRLWRVGVGLTVDLHLLSIYNKPLREMSAREERR